jgi:catechol 2,3-dioxygenase-like lactoylglutathione lyase family enzyme
MRIAFVTLAVTDQDRAKQFYVDALGWECTYDEIGPFGRWIDILPPGSDCAIALVPEQRPPTRGIVVEIDDLDAVYAECAPRGVPFAAPPAEQPHGTFAAFDDPDGNGFVFMQKPATSS